MYRIYDCGAESWLDRAFDTREQALAYLVDLQLCPAHWGKYRIVREVLTVLVDELGTRRIVEAA